jgi:hypothetical protein
VKLEDLIPGARKTIRRAEGSRFSEIPQRKEKVMKTFKIAILVSMMLFVAAPAATAADFDWIKDFNVMAQADPSGFRARLASRFKIGDAEISAVIGNVKSAADAYMVLRLGEMSGRPYERVLDKYKANQGKGWGVVAKSMGIKPGSAEFHALKRGHDLDRGPAKGRKSAKKGSSKKGSKDKEKGKGKD